MTFVNMNAMSRATEATASFWRVSSRLLIALLLFVSVTSAFAADAGLEIAKAAIESAQAGASTKP